MECEEVSVFMIDENGDIWGVVDDHDTIAEFRGIPVENFFVGDRQPGGLTEPDRNAVRFQLAPGWSDKLHKYTPSDFNAKTGMVATP